MKQKLFYGIASAATLLAVCVVILGAYTRLAHAGLGCPDWPTCYGHVWVPNTENEISAANANPQFSKTPVETHKTWPEQTHRMFASSLGLLGLILFCIALKNRDQDHPWKSIVGLLGLLVAGVIARIKVGDEIDAYLWLLVGVYFLNLLRLGISQGSSHSPFKLPAFIAGLIILQGFFGMWTVTLKLWPQVVTLHLLGGFTTLATLFLLTLRLRNRVWIVSEKKLNQWHSYKIAALIGLCIVATQIFLGGWTSANYAALACLDLPTCHGQWVPPMDLLNGFNIFQEIGPNYLGGMMDNDARTAIHYVHRVGAVITVFYTLCFMVSLWKRSTQTPMRFALLLLLAALITQVCLGLSNVLFGLPLWVAVSHNIGGAFLLLMWININYRLASTQAGDL
jgi:cytochrome c oxidase assembly protein subunit 15